MSDDESKEPATLSNETTSLFNRVLRLAETEEQRVTTSLKQERLIGEGFILVGILTFVAVLALPPKPLKWVFFVAAFVIALAGAIRIDRCTRGYRQTERDRELARKILRRRR
jgi:cobalamin biosynthesis protein CobD/CbiB